LDTSLGNIVIDLFVDECPQTCKNFLKLCAIKYYNNCIFYNVQKDYIIQTGDPTNTGRGGQSIYGVLFGEQANYFEDEIKPLLRHKEIGTVAMANKGMNLNASQFYITTNSNLEALDDKHTVFGEVSEGLDIINQINNVFTDKDGKPLQAIRIRHTIVLGDPYPDIPGLTLPERSPSPIVDPPPGFLPENLEMDDYLDEEKKEEIIEELEKKKAHTRAEVLEMVGDIPDSEIKPPDDVLFVCRLNPFTTERSLRLIFSQFGTIKSCEIIKDRQTNDSLCYGFIEYEERDPCVQAYFKMNNVLIDDRRIHVDFSQSVARVEWGDFGGWKNYFHQFAKKMNKKNNNKEKPIEKRIGYRDEDRPDAGEYSLLYDDGETPKRKKTKKINQ